MRHFITMHISAKWDVRVSLVEVKPSMQQLVTCCVFLCQTEDATGLAIFYPFNISVLDKVMKKAIPEMNPSLPKTPVSISNSFLFTLALTMFFLDTVEVSPLQLLYISKTRKTFRRKRHYSRPIFDFFCDIR